MLALIVWGAFAFGAVYPWAFRPIVYAGSVAGVLGLVLLARSGPPLLALATALALFGVATGLQMAPLDASLADRLSPRAAPVEARYRSTYGRLEPPAGVPDEPVATGGAADEPSRPLSIAPAQTRVGLTLFVALALLLLGGTCVLSVTGARPLANAVAATGIVLALVGIGQYVLTLDEPYPLVYGFWQPENVARPFGPFINPNHFAGWMLMALPVTLGLFYETCERMIADAHAYANHRMELAASPLFGIALSYGFAAVVMGLSLVMTRSRSGLTAFGLSAGLLAWKVMRRQAGRSARLAIAGSAVLIIGGAAAWAGSSVVASKFTERGVDIGTVGNRLTTWSDAWRIARDFPLTGTGLNTFGTAMYVYQTSPPQTHFQEAHNDYLQLAAEGGVLLSLPAALAVVLFAREVRRRFREAPKSGRTYWLRVGAVVGLAAIALQSMVEFSLQMPGNGVLFVMLCAIALHVSPRLRRHQTA